MIKIARGHDLKEQDRLTQAFVISRLTYALPYLALNDSEIRKIDGLIHRAHRATLQLQPSESATRLEAAGAYNTAAELIKDTALAKTTP